MDDTIYEAALMQALQQLSVLAEEKQQLDRRRAEVDQEMAIVRAKTLALQELVYEEPPPDSPIGQWLKQFEEMGLTDACREVLKASKEAMTPTEVRDALIKMGYDIGKYKNALASIHTILKRIARSDGPVWWWVRDKDNKVAYSWGMPPAAFTRNENKKVKQRKGVGKR